MNKIAAVFVLLFLLIPLVNAGYDVWSYKEDRKGGIQGFVLKHYWDYDRYEYGCKDSLGTVDWRCYKVYYEPPASSINLYSSKFKSSFASYYPNYYNGYYPGYNYPGYVRNNWQ